ncbi:sodium-dependent dicarboxylate transporter 2/3/5 [Natronospira proteinivora]|uniref:Sodium-dependent dicarboxylate transporter 2/3/5 n=1 Tax=Natronospira proteinivora TaxID=1807133 RepID=A0ABT1G5D3_9GAMM|nr:SLC13 family permease [Natronospira proteinivora]MCP1726516.1 sodium-dependent dicarboxylate transporter 2/3/5 [Natronospira proteinivora]
MWDRRRLGLFIGPLLAALAFLLAHRQGLPIEACWTAAITALCASWWISEALPIPATSLIPFAAFPLLGVLPHGEVAGAYGHTLIILLLGGFILSTAMEKNDAHRRLALGMVNAVGGRGGPRLVLGFMLASGLLSMWISNTATLLMLLPVVLAVLKSSEEKGLATPLLLGTAWSASVGGLGTPIGTPPNVIFMGVYSEITGREISFLEWMRLGVPLSITLILTTWVYLTWRMGPGRNVEIPHLGAWTIAERRVMVVFALAALAWMTRSAPLGGWSAWLPGDGYAGDATVALSAVLACFLIPDGRGGRLLDWSTAEKIPWGLLILFGGGIAIAMAFESSGLSTSLGEALANYTHWPLLALIFGICILITFMTETTSNTATATLMMPILGATALASGLEPALLMIPAAMSASCAFMLPVATAPNAVVFGTRRIPIQVMARRGFGLNFIAAGLITAFCAVLLPYIL